MMIDLEIRTFIEGLLKDKQGVLLTPQTSLIESGLLDSLQIMNLIEFLENKFGLGFQPEEMVADNFENLAAMTSLIHSKL